ncbi:hypothetical protein DMB90_12585 [Raoultella planticola]|uniref:Uncharacterized protein n=1 Tax=Raoultella planticola TaxID=575 RepID=A0A5P6ABG3_RAOPL|nr:hypothetical protein DMB90_12585 [Raoultella planticola]
MRPGSAGYVWERYRPVTTVYHDESSPLTPQSRDMQSEGSRRLVPRVISDSKQNIHFNDSMGNKGA